MKINEFIAILLQIILICICIAFFTTGEVWGVLLGIAGLLLFVLCFGGYMEIEPNNANVLTFFGKYKGTVIENGFFRVNPFNNTRELTLRARNLDVTPIKVNDKVDNPLLIGAVMVWKIKDIYKAMFDIDAPSIGNHSGNTAVLLPSQLSKRMQSYEYFVAIQNDTAIREIAGMYPYDSNESEHDKVTLRSDDGGVL